MARKFAIACFLGVFLGNCSPLQIAPTPPPTANGQQAAPPSSQQPPDESEPPEEDETIKPKVYHYDPLEAERNIKVGLFYMHQGGDRGYRAAAGRFEDATRFDPKNPEAFFRLGEAEVKLKHKQRAQAAFHRVVELSPDSKLAKEAQKKLGHTG